MVRHVVQYAHTDLSNAIDADTALSDEVTARLLFIKILGWIKTRSNLNRPIAMKLPDYPWAATLRTMLLRRPELAEAFQIQRDGLAFNQAMSKEEIAWIEEFVSNNYIVRPMR